MWFFDIPEFTFRLGFDFYALECIFDDNRFLGYLLGKWFSIPLVLLGGVFGALLSNFLVWFFLRCYWRKYPKDHPIAKAEQEILALAARTGGGRRPTSEFGNFRVAAYVSAANINLNECIKLVVILLILGFAILSLYWLDFLDCVSNPSTERIPNHNTTHRVFRSVLCYQGYHQKLVPIAYSFVMMLLALPAFVFWQSQRLGVAKRQLKIWAESKHVM